MLQQKLLLIYEASTELDNHEKRRNKERAEQEALDCFIFGLRDPPEYRVSSKNPKTLAEAVNIAIKLEGRDDAMRYQEKVTTERARKSLVSSRHDDYDSELSDENIREYTVRAAQATKVPNIIPCTICNSSLHETKKCTILPKVVEALQIISNDPMIKVNRWSNNDE